jgi:O-antigen ligase
MCVVCTIYSLVSTLIVYDLTVEYIFSDASVFSYFSWILPVTMDLKSNYYSLYIGLCLVILLDNIFNKTNKRYRPIMMIVFCYLFVFMGLLSSRTAFLAVVVFSIFYLIRFILKNEFKVSKLLIVGGILVGLIILSLQLPFMHSKVFNFLESGTESDPRHMLFQCGWQIFSDHFLFGAGIFDVEELAFDCYRSFNNTQAIEEKYNFHNVFLQWGASTGIIGLIIYITLIVLLLIRAVKIGKMIPMGFVFLFFLASLTESLLTRNKGLIFFTTFATVLLIHKPYDEDTAR